MRGEKMKMSEKMIPQLNSTKKVAIIFLSFEKVTRKNRAPRKKSKFVEINQGSDSEVVESASHFLCRSFFGEIIFILF